MTEMHTQMNTNVLLGERAARAIRWFGPVVAGCMLAATACGGDKDSGESGQATADSGLESGFGSGSSDEAGSTSTTAMDTGVPDIPTGDGTATDEGGGDCDGMVPNPDATLVGTIYAPNLEIPISGALVYVTDDPVMGIPDEVYCAECVELDCETPYVLSAHDGSFVLPVVSGPGQKLVVQKGQFLRVVDLDVATRHAQSRHVRRRHVVLSRRRRSRCCVRRGSKFLDDRSRRLG